MVSSMEKKKCKSAKDNMKWLDEKCRNLREHGQQRSYKKMIFELKQKGSKKTFEKLEFCQRRAIPKVLRWKIILHPWRMRVTPLKRMKGRVIRNEIRKVRESRLCRPLRSC